MLEQEAGKPGKSDHGFLVSEFPLCISPGFLGSCSNFDFCSQTLLVPGFSSNPLSADVTHLDFRAGFTRRQHFRPLVAVAIHSAMPDSPQEVFEVGVGRPRSARGTENIPAK